MPPQESDATPPEPAQRPAVMPEAAIKPIDRIRNGDFPVAPGEGRDHCDHLIVAQPRLFLKLVVTDAGVSLPYLYNSM